MWIPLSSGRLRRIRHTPHGLLWAALVALAGCANPGPPKPPSLNLPSPVKDLHAERIGDQVHLAWTTPADTTDEIPSKPPLSAEICRDPHPSVPAPCTVVQHLPVKPGPSSAIDPLPASLLLDPAHLLQYRVRLLNSSGHAADASNVAFAATGVAPMPVDHLRSSPSPAGNRLLWDPASFPAAAVILERSTDPSPAAQQPTPRPAAKLPSAHRKANTPAIVRLEAAPAGKDPGVTLDPSTQRDVTYSYVAWRTRTVVADGRSLTLRSPVSAPLAFTVRDLTPPAIPAGLEAVADGASVDLSWEPDSESDLAGYWVERAQLAPGTASTSTNREVWKRVNQTPLTAPAYRDQPPSGVSPLQYRVLAVDTTGNVSSPSPSVTVLPHPPSTP